MLFFPPPPALAHADEKIVQADRKSSFWVIADAVKKFYEKYGCLPLPGNVPDMKAQSKVYIRLQNIYKTKARNDVAEVLETVRRSPGGEEIDPSEVELFCKNAAFVKLVNGDGVGADHLSKVIGMSSLDGPSLVTFSAARVFVAG